MKPKYKNIFIDCGGYDDVSFRAALAASDIFLIPVKASSFDLWTLANIDSILTQNKIVNPNLKSWVLVNLAPTHPMKKDAEHAIQFIKESNFENIKVIEDIVIGERDIFKNVVKYGLSVPEFKLTTESDKSAFNEITGLYEFLFGGTNANN
jgi:chromosome partitioning protein